MHKRLKTLATLAAAAFAIVGGAANIPQEWAVEVSRVRQYQFQANRGDTMELKATFWHDGEPFDLGGDVFRLYWQTNAMESVYWSAPATAASNTVSAVFANTMDPGAPIVYGFLGATSGNYRASFSIRFAPGPGAVPNALPLPAATIDFAKVEVLNPPYYTQAEVNSISNALATSIAEIDASAIEEIRGQTETNTTDIATLTIDLAAAASSATNYTDSVAQGLRDDIASAATLTPIYSFSEWVCNPATVDGWDVFVKDKSDETPPLWALEIDSIGEVDYLPYDADAITLVFADEGVTATRNRTLIGYTLGSQSDKPLQPKGDYAPATNIAKSALAQDVQISLGKADTALQTTGGTMMGPLTVDGHGPDGDIWLSFKRDNDAIGMVFHLNYISYYDLDFALPRSAGTLALTAGTGHAGNLAALDANGNPVDSGAALANIAPLASPAFTGAPTAPTPASGDNSTKVATTAFVQAAISGISVTPLSGQTFNFATTQGVMDALKTVIEALGGTVTNAPSLTISQGE